MATSAKELGKKIIGYPERVVPVVTVKDWFSQFNRNPIQQAINYVVGLFPIIGWISRYNLGWLTGDVIAGLTVGIVLVPQGMSYAQIATLPVQYGLYSSFVGVLIYCFFATSKDVSIGPVAVMSLTVSQIIAHVDDAHPGKWEGPEIATTVAFICGFIVLGIGLLRLGWLVEFIPAPAVSGFMTGSAINIASGQVPGLMGITGFKHRGGTKGKFPIKILGTVPAGLQHVGQPTIDPELVSALAGELPVATIILLLEHIAISKSFGRVNNYKINPNQELIAIGVTNTIGSCFGAYPATGSFSRSALKSKSGVRTPAAGILSAIVVIVALYGLTPAFFWIPNAGLSAIIIHAVADLVASPRQVYSYWRVSPLEFLIWAAAVLVTIFSTIEIGVYVSVCVSLALLLIRVAHPRGYFLGKITLRTDAPGSKDQRDVFVPLARDGMTNPDIKVSPPAPGVIVYRFEESYLYPNSSIVNSVLVDYVKANMRRGKDMSNVKLSDRPWNDPGPRQADAAYEQERNSSLPDIHAVVLDFSTVSHIDTTATQALIDTRNEIERWADHPVEFHFASILSPWIRRALVAGGFGLGTPSSRAPHEIAAVVPYRDGLGDRQLSDLRQNVREHADDIETGLSTSAQGKESINSFEIETTGYAPLLPLDTPFFHLDLESAVRAAESGLELRS
ncbi:sulfate permease [Lentinula edodes]|uniref:Sulfate permease n=1 Tax=Lentinula edodes TaxID=5353 RepID=A0A1Q3EJQ3_LENED|nr:sulfate permease [Lentinula edodes]